MNARTQSEIDAVVEQTETAAGFSTEAVDKAEEGNERAARRRQAQLDNAGPQFIAPVLGDTLPSSAGFRLGDKLVRRGLF